MIKRFTDILFDCKELAPYKQKLKAGQDVQLSVASLARPLIVAAEFVRKKRCMLVIVAGKKKANAFAGELKMLLGPDDVFLYEPLDDNTQDNREISKFLLSLYALNYARDKIVVTSSSGLLKKIKYDKSLSLSLLKIKKDQEYDRDKFIEDLANLGYERYDGIEGPGTFSVKGDNIEVFPAHLDFPVRVEFFIDQVEDIKKIIQTTGQSILSLDHVEFASCKKMDELAERFPITDLISKDVLIVQDEPRAIIDNAQIFYDKIETEFNISTTIKKKQFIHPAQITFTKNQSLMLLSIMQRGANPDCKLTLKRPAQTISLNIKSQIIDEYKADK